MPRMRYFSAVVRDASTPVGKGRVVHMRLRKHVSEAKARAIIRENNPGSQVILIVKEW